MPPIGKYVLERFPRRKESGEELKPLEEFATPGVKTIEDLAHFLKGKKEKLLKSLFFTYFEKSPGQKDSLKEKNLVVLCSGTDEISPFKLKQNLGLKEKPLLASSEKVKEITGADPGSCGPWNLKKNVPVYVDQGLERGKNFTVGANRSGFHVKNVNPVRDFKVEGYGDFCFANEGDLSPKGDSVLKKYRGIEVGHLFFLSDTYSKIMNLVYLDQKGQSRFVEMGCYGFGLTRTLQALVEQSHDDQGIMWPLPVSPFAVHICLIDPEDSRVSQTVEKLIPILKKQSLDYFVDDRKERPGVKFKDADLLGFPLRLNIGARDLKKFLIEVCIRKTGWREKLSLSQFEKKLNSLVSQL